MYPNISFRPFHEAQFNVYFITSNLTSWNSYKICKNEPSTNYDRKKMNTKENQVFSLLLIDRSSHQRRSLIKGVLRNFAKFTPHHQSTPFLKKRSCHRCFAVNFAKLLRIPFSQNSSGQLLLKIKILFIYNSEKTTPIYFQIV